ncbi:hypothetical protein ACFFGV_14910 [Pontibacillus salicampi]|uniref:YfhD family protein n=1 Tax=Pontibacillus salicampi TaxID=1449801 RepID=A0ABV6LRD5_9BACI
MAKRNQEKNNKPEKQKRDQEFGQELDARDYEKQERNAEAKAMKAKKDNK